MSYQCDNCNRKVGVVRYDDKKWVCDNCYFKKDTVKYKDNANIEAKNSSGQTRGKSWKR